MYTIQLENRAQRALVAAALTRAIAGSPYEARVTGDRVHRLPCGTLAVTLQGKVERRAHAGHRTKAENVKIRAARRAMRKGGKSCLFLEGITRRERGPCRGNYPPEVLHHFKESRRKTGFKLDWTEWLAFNAFVNDVLDATIGRRGDIWTHPYVVRKLVIRQDGRAVTGYDSELVEKWAGGFRHKMGITPLFE